MTELQKPTRAIFLDVDGVLISSRTHCAENKGKKWNMFDPIAMMLIRRICEELHCTIVISSSWRKGKDGPILRETLFKNGLLKYVHEDWATIEYSGLKRGREIQEWLSRHAEITEYVILDDCLKECFSVDQEDNHLILTDSMEGFLYKDYVMTSYILRGVKKSHIVPDDNDQGTTEDY